MKFSKTFASTLLALGVLSIFQSTVTQAQDSYPNKPINFIVPYAAGGGADSRSRQMAQKMSVILKQPIIVDNKPGAGGNIGTESSLASPFLLGHAFHKNSDHGNMPNRNSGI